MNKNIWLCLLLVLLSVGLVNAGITLTDTTTAGSFIGTGAQVAFTMNETGGNYGAAMVTSCNASLTSSLTANSTDKWTVNQNASVTVNANMTWVINISSTQYQDSNDYTVKINCSNATASFYQGTLSTGKTVDNDLPDTPTSILPATGLELRSNNTVYVYATIVDNSTTKAWIVWRDSTPTGHATDTLNCSSALGSTCSKTLTSIPDGTYYWTIRAGDGTNNTDATYNWFMVDFQGMTGASKAIIYTGVEEASESNKLGPILVIAAIGVVLYLALGKGNGGKRKR